MNMNEQTNPEVPPETDEQKPGSDPNFVNQQGTGEDPAHELGSDPQAPAQESAPDAESSVDLTHVKRVLEAALLSTTEPLNLQQLRRLFSGQVNADNIRKVLDELKG